MGKQSYKPSMEELNSLLQEDGLTAPKNDLKTKFTSARPQKSTLDYLGEGAGAINDFVEGSGIPNLAAGFLSSPQKTAVNVLNLPKALGVTDAKAELPDWLNPSSSKNLPDNPQARMMGMGGEILGDLLSGGLGYKAASKLSGVNNATSLANRAATGAGVGAAVSGDDQPGGRLAGAALGGLAPALHGLTRGAIGERAGDLAEKTEAKFKGLYENLFDAAEKAPKSRMVDVPSALKTRSKEVSELVEHYPAKYKNALEEFVGNPTLKNAHDAQSDLGKYIRHIGDRRVRGETLSSSEQDSYHAAQKIRDDMKTQIHEHFAKSGRPELAIEYENLSNAYKKELAPLKNPALSKLRGGKISSDKAGKELLGNLSFAESDPARQIPGYQARRQLNKAAPLAQKFLTPAVVTALALSGVPMSGYLARILEGK